MASARGQCARTSPDGAWRRTRGIQTSAIPALGVLHLISAEGAVGASSANGTSAASSHAKALPVDPYGRRIGRIPTDRVLVDPRIFGLAARTRVLAQAARPAAVFVGEEVVLTAADGKPVGTVIETLRGGSPSNKENETKYNVQVGEEIVREVPHSKLKRKEKLEQSDLFSFITSVARKPTANGPWLLRDEFIKSYGGNQKLHPIFAMKSRRLLVVKARLSAKEDEPPLITLDDSDDDEPVVVAGPSTNGTAGGKKKKATPKTPKLPRPKKTSSTKKSPTKKTIKKSPTAAKSKAGTSRRAPPKRAPRRPPRRSRELLEGEEAPKKAAEKNGTAGTSKSTSKKETAPKKEAAPKKKAAKQLNISAFLTPNTSGSQKDSPVLSFEQRMEKKALNTSKQIVKKIVNMDTADLAKVLEAAARSLPAKFTTGIANEFVRYLIEKTRVKQEAKSLDVAERAEYRKKHVYAFEARNEFYFMQHRLMSGELFVKCTRVAIFVQSYREILGIRKAVGILELHAALKAEEKEDAFAKTTAPLLAGITEFIRRNQKSIPHFTRGGFLASSIRFVSADIAQEVARKVLFPAYRPFADESRSRSASTSRMTTPMDKGEW
ncbi:hypothetical protein M3Y99_01451900 [Aphelenchoides fujianensis]|nr:hypothetical protein M3Y99_01451900 [Aphelenchoides fujianensis]